MKSITRIVLIIIILAANATVTIGQASSDNIIFLSDLYISYIDKAMLNHNEADKIYTENIHKVIYNNYFQKSEYADIVYGFLTAPLKNTAELKKTTDRIVLHQETIKSKIHGALRKSREHIKNDSLTIYIIPANPDNRQITESMMGIMGLTAGSKQIILSIEPDILGWENMLEYAVAHEFNHAYWTKMNFGKSARWTLLDYLVFEGRGDYFAHQLYPEVKAPWTLALNTDQKNELWNKIKTSLQSEDFSYHLEVMFGSMNYPVWGGYSLGYDIVLTALKNNKNLSTSNWSNLTADKMLEQSEYK